MSQKTKLGSSILSTKLSCEVHIKFLWVLKEIEVISFE